VPDHQLLHPIAAGAYGEVWLCRNIVGSLRAVKIVRQDSHSSAESFAREFKGLQKFEPVSRSHEGLVDILTLGLLTEPAGFYYIMELADAQETPKGQTKDQTTNTSSSGSRLGTSATYAPRTLRAELKLRGALPADEVIQLGLKLCAALNHLHAQGLVHRDVKPSNILFVGGEPKLADAGLVAAVDDARSLVGTAGYIAPEGPGTPQADLYALGKVLYEAAFGKDRQEFPAIPAEVTSRPDHDRLLELNAILLKACAVDERERYQSADELRADLELLQSGRSVKGLHARKRTWILAKRFGLAVSALAVVSTLAYVLSSRLSRPSGSAQPRQNEFVWSANELANEEFRQGVRSLQATRETSRAIQYFENAIQKDLNFAEAYAHLAWACYSSGDDTLMPKGIAAAKKSVVLNTNLAYGHSVLASAQFFELNWAEGEKERALAVAMMDPNSPSAEEILLESALNLVCCGKTNEALRDLERARNANPDSASNTREVFYGMVYAWCRRYDRAFEIWSQFPDDKDRAQAYLAMGDFTNFMRFRKKAALELAVNPDQVKAEFEALDKAFQQRGQQKYWERCLELESSKRDSDHLMRMAAIHARLHQPVEAFRYLRRAMQETPAWFSSGLYTNPSFDSLRDEREFQEIMAELWRKK